jgi:hypothetical protein
VLLVLAVQVVSDDADNNEYKLNPVVGRHGLGLLALVVSSLTGDVPISR